ELGGTQVQVGLSQLAAVVGSGASSASCLRRARVLRKASSAFLGRFVFSNRLPRLLVQVASVSSKSGRLGKSATSCLERARAARKESSASLGCFISPNRLPRLLWLTAKSWRNSGRLGKSAASCFKRI